MSPPIDPQDLGQVNTGVSSSTLNQPFPQIYQPFVKENGVINESWLRLLIALWNRTGYAPGASSLEALEIAWLNGDIVAEREGASSGALAALSAAISTEVRRQIELSSTDSPLKNELAALLFETPSAASAEEEAAEWCMEVVSAPAGMTLTGAEACGTLFLNG